MKHVPTIEIKNRNLEQVNKYIQKRVESIDSRVSNMEKIVKKLANQNCSILMTMVDNFNTLLNKMDQSKGLDSYVMIKDQGPSKCTRANPKNI